MKILTFVLLALMVFSCKKERSCECESVIRTCKQVKDKAGFILYSSCKDSITSKKISVSNCNSYNSSKSGTDSLVVYDMIECTIY